MANKLKPARRVETLPPYIFKEIDDRKRALTATGTKLLNFGIGDPDLPTPDFIINAMDREMRKTTNQKYPAYDGCISFRKAIAAYMKTRFGVSLDFDSEIMALIGSKEGLAHFSWAFIDEGDVTLVPDPGYPVYGNTTCFSGGEPFLMPLLEKNNFLPDLSKIPDGIAKRAKILFLNYPNNPTGAIAEKESLQAIVDWARKHEVIIVYDAAYAELTFDAEDRLSILALPGARDIAIEFHSFSKIFNMTGWRIGFAVGNKSLISGLLKMKTNVDSGVFEAVQLACAQGLEQIGPFLEKQIATYRDRLNEMKNILTHAGFSFYQPRGTFYLWTKCPPKMTSAEWTLKLLEKGGIVTTPGTGFGKYGEGYVRFALTQPQETIYELESRLKNQLGNIHD